MLRQTQIRGWTLLQIATAKERHLGATGAPLTPDVGGLRALQDWWAARYCGDPAGSRMMCGHESRDWAAQVLASVTRLTS